LRGYRYREINRYTIYFYLKIEPFLLRGREITCRMAFKEFGLLLSWTVQYEQDNSIKLIITENEIYEVRFSPRHHAGPHGIHGIETTPRTLLYKSSKPFRIDDLAHYPIYSERDWASGDPVMFFSSTDRPEFVRDRYITEVKYRQVKNDKIEELEKQISLTATPLGRRPFGTLGAVKIDTCDVWQKARRVWNEIDYEDASRDLLVCKTKYEQLQRENKLLESYVDEANSRCAKLSEVARRLRDENKSIQIAQEREERTRLEIAELKSLKQSADSENQTIVAEPIPECECDSLKSQLQSLKLQLAAEKRISQKYARDLQERDKQQACLTAM